MKLIARNKHKYTMTSQFPENFWEDWKENKEALKEKGYSPFKIGKDWYLALYDNEQEATDEEFEQFNKMNVEKGLEFLKEIYPDLQQKVVDILKEKCENIDTLYAFLSSNRKIFTNSKDVQIISDKIFDFNLNLSD